MQSSKEHLATAKETKPESKSTAHSNYLAATTSLYNLYNTISTAASNLFTKNPATSTHDRCPICMTQPLVRRLSWLTLPLQTQLLHPLHHALA